MTTCPTCEYHKDRAARWRAEAYKQAGHDVIELPWVGLTDVERHACTQSPFTVDNYLAIEAKLREKNQ